MAGPIVPPRSRRESSHPAHEDRISKTSVGADNPHSGILTVELLANTKTLTLTGTGDSVETLRVLPSTHA